MIENKVNNNTDINKVEETKLNIVGDTKMQNTPRTKEITVEVQVHKDLKKAEVENLFHMEGVTFEVKRRTVYATKEISLPKEGSSFMMVLAAENKAEYEIEDHVIETMNAFYLEKCHVLTAEHERKFLIEEAARIAKLKELGLIDDQGRDIEIEEEEEEEEEAFVGETEMQEEVIVNDDTVNDNAVGENTTGDTKMIDNVDNDEKEEENCFFSNNIFYYDWNNSQSVYVENDNYAFHNGYHYEQITEICGDNFFNSILKGVLEEYRLEYNLDDKDIVFKNVLEDDEQDFEETPGYMVLVETQKKIVKMLEGYPVDEIFKIKEDNELMFQGLINYHYEC